MSRAAGSSTLDSSALDSWAANPSAARPSGLTPRDVYDLGEATATWLPPALRDRVPGQWRVERRRARNLEVTVRTFFPSPEGIAQIAHHLREAAPALRLMPIAELLDLFDGLAERWLDVDDPTRLTTIERVVAATGFSPEMVAHAFDVEQESSRRSHLERALAQELGDPTALDEATPNPWLMGRTRIVGPSLVGAIFSANIPGLPHLEVMRYLAVKAPCLGKVPGGEPIFLAAYLQTLVEAAPHLADCVCAIGLDRDDEAGRATLLGAVDHLVGDGGTQTIETLRAAAPPGLATTWHGHRLGFAVVLREALDTAEAADRVAQALAYDFSLFEQEACLAPAAVYVEAGGAVTATGVAERIAFHMRDEARRLPPRELDLGASAALRGWLDDLRLDGATVVAAPAGLPFVVAVDRHHGLAPTPPGRTVRVVALEDAATLDEALRPMTRFLQCAAIAGEGRRMHELGDRLARLGVTRLTRPGLMGLPSMMWRHDGRSCLASMVRYCDEEVLAPRDNALGPAGRSTGRS